MRNLSAPLVSSLLASAVALAACSPASSSPSAAGPPEVMDYAALAERVKPRGDEVVLVNFWATWCPPCVKEMPELVELHEEADGYRVEAVALDIVMPRRVKTAEGIGEFADKKGFALPIVAYDGDPRALMENFGMGSGIPYTVVLDRRGEIADRLTGAGNKARFRKMIDAARRR